MVSDTRPPSASATSWTRPAARSTSPRTVASTASHIIGRAALTSVARASPWKRKLPAAVSRSAATANALVGGDRPDRDGGGRAGLARRGPGRSRRGVVVGRRGGLGRGVGIVVLDARQRRAGADAEARPRSARRRAGRGAAASPPADGRRPRARGSRCRRRRPARPQPRLPGRRDLGAACGEGGARGRRGRRCGRDVGGSGGRRRRRRRRSWGWWAGVATRRRCGSARGDRGGLGGSGRCLAVRVGFGRAGRRRGVTVPGGAHVGGTPGDAGRSGRSETVPTAATARGARTRAGAAAGVATASSPPRAIGSGGRRGLGAATDERRPVGRRRRGRDRCRLGRRFEGGRELCDQRFDLGWVALDRGPRERTLGADAAGAPATPVGGGRAGRGRARERGDRRELPRVSNQAAVLHPHRGQR